MASNKKKRKGASAARKLAKPAAAGPFRHRDGDRRHREVMAKAIKDAKAQKEALQHIGEVPLPEEE